MIKIVAFTGKAGSGKTTAAKYTAHRCGYTRLRFADALKRMLKELGLSNEEIDGNLKLEPCKLLGGKTPRYAMQTLGTEWGRELIHSNLWVEALNIQLMKYVSKGITEFVIEDLRFVNEATYLDSLRGDGCKVVIVGIERESKKDTGNHVSETQMNNIEPDHFIFNNYSLEILYKSIDNILDLYFNEEEK